MTIKYVLILLINFILISFLSCANGGENKQTESSPTIELPDDGIVIEDAWARPGSENGVSAIYMNILNGSSEADTLVAISSPAAGMVEVHESYEREKGMMGMRQAENAIIPARDALDLEPGGLHVMLMQLNQELTEGGEVEFTIEFANAGKITLTAPVQLMQ